MDILDKKINNLTWYDGIGKLKQILKSLKDNTPTEPPYKVYTALLSQSGTDAPVATVLENTIGNITFQYIDVGNYVGTSSALFTENKTFIVFSNTANGGYIYTDGQINNGEFVFFTARVIDNEKTDDFLLKTPIEIRVYN